MVTARTLLGLIGGFNSITSLMSLVRSHLRGLVKFNWWILNLGSSLSAVGVAIESGVNVNIEYVSWLAVSIMTTSCGHTNSSKRAT